MDGRPTSAKDNGPTAREVDFDLLHGLIGYHLRRAQVSMFNDFVNCMAETKITPGQFGVIALISANPGLTQSALARAIGIERSTMVAVIDSLEKRGLVERRSAPTDRRSYALIMTAAGDKLFAALKPLVADHEDRIAHGLSAKERTLLIELLRKVSAPA